MRLYEMYKKPARLDAQPRIHGVQRVASFLGMLPELAECVYDDVLEYGVSPSFVLCSIAAKHYGITEQPDFRTWKRTSTAKRRKKRRTRAD